VKSAKSPQPNNNGSQSRQETQPESGKGSDVGVPANQQAEPVMKYQTAANSLD
jgi:hypothetical protein